MLWRSPQGQLLSLLSDAFPSFRNDSCISDLGLMLTSLTTVTKDLTRRNVEEEEFILTLVEEARWYAPPSGSSVRLGPFTSSCLEK